MATAKAEYLTQPKLAAEWGCKVDLILALIHSGELIAYNLTKNPNGERPRWRIAREEAERFLASRASKPAEPKPQPKRRRKSTKPTRAWV